MYMFLLMNLSSIESMMINFVTVPEVDDSNSHDC